MLMVQSFVGQWETTTRGSLKVNHFWFWIHYERKAQIFCSPYLLMEHGFEWYLTKTILTWCFECSFFLQNYIKFGWGYAKFPIKVILDNASIHQASQTMKLAQFLKMELHYLPPYWLHLAPIEQIFGALKKRITVMRSECVFWLFKTMWQETNYWRTEIDKKRNMKEYVEILCLEAKRDIIEADEKEGEELMLYDVLNKIEASI